MISSTSNPRVQSARRLKRRSDREQAGAFLIESILTLEAAVGAGISVIEAFVDEGAGSVADRCEALGVKVTLVSERVLRSIAEAVTPQGVVAVASIPDASLAQVPDEASLVLVLAQVNDPGNAGTLVRSAAASGADAVVFTTDGVDPYAPKTVRSSAGALFAMPVVRDIPLGEALTSLEDRGLTVYLAEAGKGRIASDADLTAPLALVVGNEARGISVPDGTRGASFLRIPMPGPVESLNVGVAGSILLYEVVRQRRDTAG